MFGIFLLSSGLWALIENFATSAPWRVAKPEAQRAVSRDTKIEVTAINFYTGY